ncbi:MAG TPA: hypothetical protein DCS36_08760 [Sphingobacterium sp.]|nr:hypothetical protein [Sphingobacterium sp.]HAT92473.1 hypothetical protein [Sphingobacterium sp.]
MQLNVDCLSRKATGVAMGCRPLNIRYGNGVSVVVRARESLVHGEGRQLILFNTINGKCERHYEKSRKRIKQSGGAQQTFGL